MRRLVRIVESIPYFILVGAGVVGGLIAFLDLIGRDLQGSPFDWLKQPLPLILLLVSTLSLSVGWERLFHLNRMNDRLAALEELVEGSQERVINALRGADTRSFERLDEFWTYAAKRVREAKKRVDDLSWGGRVQHLTKAEDKAFQKYLSAVKTCCGRDIPYKEIMSFSDPVHFSRADSLLSPGLSSYHLRYYDVRLDNTAPAPLPFMVVDGEEVIIALYYQSPGLAAKEMLLAVKHPHVSKVFLAYHEAMFRKATWIKDGSSIDHAAYRRLKERAKVETSRTAKEPDR
jgi:hypothetical protein